MTPKADAFIASIHPLEPRCLLSFALFGTETAVGLLPGGSSSVQDSAVARDGSYIVAGVVSTANTSAIVASRYSANGNPVGNTLTLATLPIAPNSNPPRFNDISVATDADGDSVVAFSVFDLQNSTTSIYFMRITRNGAFGARRFLTTGNARNPQITMSDDGNFYVGWTTVDHRDTYVRIAAFNANGDPLAARFTAAHNQGLLPSQVLDLRLSAAADGSSAVFSYSFLDDNDAFGNVHVFHGLVSNSATLNDAASVPEDFSKNARVAMLTDGSYVVGYEVLPLVNLEPIYDMASTFIQRFDSGGDAMGSAIDVGTALGSEGVHLGDLTAISDGGFAVALFTDSGATTAIYAQRYLNSGLPDHAQPVLVDASSSSGLVAGDRSSISADQNGTALVSYREQDAANSGPDTVHYRRLTGQPGAIDKSALYVLGTDSGDILDISPRGLSIVVTRGPEVRRFDPTLISQISIQGFGGDDYIINNTSFLTFIDGGEGNDTVEGGSGVDKITGAGGNDRLYGQGGNDLIYGQDGDDSLFGGEGSDILNGGGGTDSLRGEGGNDRIYAADIIQDFIFGQGPGDYGAIDNLDFVYRTA